MIKNYGWGKYCSKPCQYKGHTASNSPCWIGDNISYKALHNWVVRRWGKANKCENNEEHEGRFEWANMSKNYLRERSDWKMLCVSCHKKYDYTDERKKHMSLQAIKATRDSLGRFVGNIN